MRVTKITLLLPIVVLSLVLLSFSHTPNASAQSATESATEAPTGQATIGGSNNSRLVYLETQGRVVGSGGFVIDQTEVMFVDPLLKTITGSGGTIYTNPSANRGTGAVPWLVNGAAILSPNGRLIAFAGQVNSGQNLYVMSPDGSNLRQLAECKNSAGATQTNCNLLAWSPDSTQILYVYLGVNYQQNSEQTIKLALYLISVDGSSKPQQIQLATPANFVSYIYPTWSPDGTHVLLAVDENTDPTKAPQLGLVDIDLASKQVIPVLRDHHYLYPTWSPDSKHLLLEYFDDKAKKLMVIITDLDGSNSRPLPIPDNAYVGPFAWSPDGTQIAFIANDTVAKDGKTTLTGKHHIDVVNADGSNLTTLVDLLTIDINTVSSLSWGIIPPDVLASIHAAPPAPTTIPTRTLPPTRTPIPTRTPRPTITPRPSRTPRPTATPKS